MTIRRAPARAREAKPAKRARPASAKATPAQASLTALRDELAALARAVSAQTEAIAGLQAGPGSPAAATADVVSRLGGGAELLLAIAADLPRAHDFQPLADHL